MVRYRARKQAVDPTRNRLLTRAVPFRNETVNMTKSTSPATAPPIPSPSAAGRYDRSIVEGALRPAVWKLAWPAMLTNMIGGLQGIVDHALVGHLVGYTGNAAIGVAWQIFIVVIDQVLAHDEDAP